MPATPTRRTGGTSLQQVFEWVLTDENPDGISIPSSDSDLSDRAVQVYANPGGSFGGGTVEWQGTSDASQANWHTLNTTAGLAASFSQAGIKQILESTLFARPVLVGAGDASVTVVLVARKPTRG